jgi:hypothetical protein
MEKNGSGFSAPGPTRNNDPILPAGMPESAVTPHGLVQF